MAFEQTKIPILIIIFIGSKLSCDTSKCDEMSNDTIGASLAKGKELSRDVNNAGKA